MPRVSAWVLAVVLLVATTAVGYAASTAKRVTIDVTGEYDTNWGYVFGKSEINGGPWNMKRKNSKWIRPEPNKPTLVPRLVRPAN